MLLLPVNVIFCRPMHLNQRKKFCWTPY